MALWNTWFWLVNRSIQSLDIRHHVVHRHVYIFASVHSSVTETGATFIRLALFCFIQTQLAPSCVSVIECSENHLRGLVA